MFPLQHPFGHEVASQTHCPFVVLHRWPLEHAAQAAPPLPQEPFASDAYGTQVLPLQQPLGHEAASHTH